MPAAACASSTTSWSGRAAKTPSPSACPAATCATRTTCSPDSRLPREAAPTAATTTSPHDPAHGLQPPAVACAGARRPAAALGAGHAEPGCLHRRAAPGSRHRQRHRGRARGVVLEGDLIASDVVDEDPFVVRVTASDVVVDCGGHRIEYARSEEHTSELQSPCNLVCRLL